MTDQAYTIEFDKLEKAYKHGYLTFKQFEVKVLELNKRYEDEEG